MQYYLKNSVSEDIEGPFSIERLNSMISQSAIDSKFLATSDLGEPLSAIRKQRDNDWLPLGDIPGIIGIPATENERVLPSLSREAIIFLVLIVLAALTVMLWWFVAAAKSSGMSDS